MNEVNYKLVREEPNGGENKNKIELTGKVWKTSRWLSNGKGGLEERVKPCPPKEYMNYADIKFPDVQDGEGIRVALYVSGCHFHCKECHNKDAWNFNYGKKFTDDTIDEIMNILRKPYVQGLSLLGGEPLEIINQQGLLPLVKKVKEELPEKNIWCWTGYKFDEDILNNMYEKNDFTKELMENIDIIVDGQFEIENNMVDLAFRGSTNQRKIDVQQSLKEGRMVTLKFGDEFRYENTSSKKPKIMYYKEFEKTNKNLTKEPENSTISINISQVDIFDKNNSEHKIINEQKIAEKIAATNID